MSHLRPPCPLIVACKIDFSKAVPQCVITLALSLPEQYKRGALTTITKRQHHCFAPFVICRILAGCAPNRSSKARSLHSQRAAGLGDFGTESSGPPPLVAILSCTCQAVTRPRRRPGRLPGRGRVSSLHFDRSHLFRSAPGSSPHACSSRFRVGPSARRRRPSVRALVGCDSDWYFGRRLGMVCLKCDCQSSLSSSNSCE